MFKKNLFKKILFYMVIFIISTQNIILANEIDDDEINLDSLETSSYNFEVPKLNSKYAIVLERTTSTVLFEKNAYSQTAMASTTKIMTALVAIERSNLSDIVTISSKAANTGGSTLGINANTQYSMKTLLYGLLMRSGNDCAVAIAEYIAGNVAEFANLMNAKAKELNLQNTNFVTPHGLDATDHYTTAYDLAILTNYALQNSIFSDIVKTKNTTIDMNGYSRSINNTHELLGYIDGVYGVKTGFTGNAGRCLVTSCKRGDLDIIIVVLGADTKKIRTTDSVNLINYIYNNFEMCDTSNYLNSNFKSQKLKIKNSFHKAETYLEEKDNYIYPISKINKEFKLKVYILENQKAPIKSNSKIGILKVFVNDNFLFENNVLIKNDINSISISEYYIYIVKILKDNFVNISF